eukprot:461879_1
MGSSTSKNKGYLQTYSSTLLSFEKKWDISNAQDKTIDIVCYNVYFRGYNRKGTIDAICQIKADIVILQETNKNWENVITNNTIITCKWKHIKCINDRYGEGGTILLTNYEIKSLNIIERYHRWWYGAHLFTLNIPNNKHVQNEKRYALHLRKDPKNSDDNNEENITQVQVYSIHLIAPFPPNNLKQLGCCCIPCDCCPCECCGDSRNDMRVKEIKHCLNDEYFNNKMPTLIVGDFNCMDGDCHVMIENEFGLKSGWNNMKKHNYLCCCKHEPYSWRGVAHYMCCCAPKLFDHIYYSPYYFDLVHSDVIKIGESDHYPIWSRLNTKF